jgi:hypothetical protein
VEVDDEIGHHVLEPVEAGVSTVRHTMQAVGMAAVGKVPPASTEQLHLKLTCTWQALDVTNCLPGGGLLGMPLALLTGVHGGREEPPTAA